MIRRLYLTATLSLLLLLSACQATKDFSSNFTASPVARDQPAIATMPKAYAPSSMAIGKERDVNDYRVQGEGLVSIPVLSNYLNNLLDKIKKEAGIPNLPGTVYITSNEGLDAFATADGNIFLGIGFLKNIDTEDQIVAILAHELAHIIYGHHNADMFSRLQKQVQQGAAMSAQIHASLSTIGTTQTAAVSARTLKHLQQAQLLIEITDIALLPAWSRRQEDEADALSLDLTTRMGYSYARGMKSMLELLSSQEEKIEKKHAEKRALLQAQFEKELKETGNLKPEKLLVNAWESIKGKMAGKHDSAENRIINTAEYHEKFYTDSPYQTRVHKSEWDRIIKNRTVKQTIDNYDLAFQADDLRVAGQYRKALELARRASSGITASHPFPLRVLAQVQIAMGDQKGFDATLLRSARSTDPSWQLIQLKADRELSMGKKSQARETMEKGFRHFQEPPNLRPAMIAFYTRSGEPDIARRMATECAFSSPEKRDSCFKAGK